MIVIKKANALFLFVCIFFSLTGCSAGSPSNEDALMAEIAELKQEIATLEKQYEIARTYMDKYEELLKELSLEEDEKTNDSKVYSDGQYKIGVDIPAGEYKLTPINTKNGIYYTITSDANGKNIIANDYANGEQYLIVEDGQYLKISNCNMEPVK